MRCDHKFRTQQEEVENSSDTGYIMSLDKPWREYKLGFLPRRCYYTNKWLLPFRVVGARTLMYVGEKGIWSKMFFTSTERAIIENLKL